MRVLSTLALPILVFGAAADAAAQKTHDAAPAAVDGYWRRDTDSVRPSLRAVRVSGGPPEIDGRLGEDVWQQAPEATGFIQLEPTPGAPERQRTEARVAYDDEAIYVAMRMHDTAPDSIVGNLARRDDDVYSDWAHVLIDSYNDRRTGFRFSVNPRGVRADALHFDDTNDDDSWDAVWAVATSQDSLGWSAEFRIPLSQLRFRSSDGGRAVAGAGAPAAGAEMLWGINFARQIARHNELSFWAPIRPDVPGLVSRSGTLTGLSGLEAPRNLELLPYTVAKVTREPGDAEDPFYEATAPFASVGGDLKYGVTSDLTLSATINPDFGQVEADPSQVNLSAYETFLPEKRPFFLEGSDIFRFGIGLGDGDGGNEQLFYSRRIGRSPQGEVDGDYTDVPTATTILGAAKLSGKTAGGWSIGFLDAVTAAERGRYVAEDGLVRHAPVEPMTNYAVVRVRKDFSENSASTVGGLFTATNRRLDEADAFDFLRSAAYSGGVDARHRFGGGNWEARGRLVGSYVQGSDTAIARTQRRAGRYFERPDAEHLAYDATRTSLGGYAGNVEVAKRGGGHWRGGGIAHLVSPGFEINDLGYQRMNDVSFLVGFLFYEQFKPGPLFRNWQLGTNAWSGWSFGKVGDAVVPFAGDRVDFGGNVNGGVSFHNNWSLWFWSNRQMGGSLDPYALRGGPAIRGVGNTNVGFNVNGDDRKSIIPGLNMSGWWEDETDGYSYGIYPRVRVRPTSSLELSLNPGIRWNRDAWQYVTGETVAGEPRYVFARLDQTTASLTARLSYTFTPGLSLQFYAQPFVSAGRYSRFMEVADPRAESFADRFDVYGSALVYDEDAAEYAVDRNGDGRAELAFGNPNFNFKQLNTNAVLRWEWRAGSTLYVVWSQGRTAFDENGSFELGRDFGRLLGTSGDPIEGTNVLMIKASYWLGL